MATETKKKGLKLKAHLGDVIKAEREKRKLTQEAFAPMVGVGQGNLSALEKRAGHHMGMSTAVKVANALGCGIEVFFE